MSSFGRSRIIPEPTGGKSALQRLRREAGYRSAKEFADHLGISVPAYARCERVGSGLESDISLRSAWQIADHLGCTIDFVVGRAAFDAHSGHSIQARYDALTREGRALVESYLDYVEAGERK